MWFYIENFEFYYKSPNFGFECFQKLLIKNIIQYYIEYRISIIYNIVIVQANRE